jgi:hypothetical protein
MFSNLKHFSKRSKQRGPASRRLAAVLLLILAGCASSAGSQNSSVQELQEGSPQIASREQQCMDAAVNRANDQLSQIAPTTDASSEQRAHAVKVQRSQDLFKCKAAAEHENEELSSREQVEYERQGHEENDRAIMLWLIASPPP